ncbi:hypothetical protein D3C71_2135380 [compost metagenome]
MNVLQDRPKLDAVAGHQTHGAFDRGEISERGELVEQIQYRQVGFGGITRHVKQALRHQQA